MANTYRASVQMPITMHQELEAAAAENYRSVSAEIVSRLMPTLKGSKEITAKSSKLAAPKSTKKK